MLSRNRGAVGQDRGEARAAALRSSCVHVFRRPWECWFACSKKCKEYEISLKLCNISPDIFQVFKITGLDKFFSIYTPTLPTRWRRSRRAVELYFRTHRETRHDLSDGDVA